MQKREMELFVAKQVRKSLGWSEGRLESMPEHEDPPDVVWYDSPHGTIAIEVSRLNFDQHETRRENVLADLVKRARAEYDQTYGEADHLWVSICLRRNFSPSKRDVTKYAKLIAQAIHDSLCAALFEQIEMKLAAG